MRHTSVHLDMTYQSHRYKYEIKSLYQNKLLLRYVTLLITGKTLIIFPTTVVVPNVRQAH